MKNLIFHFFVLTNSHLEELLFEAYKKGFEDCWQYTETPSKPEDIYQQVAQEYAENIVDKMILDNQNFETKDEWDE